MLGCILVGEYSSLGIEQLRRIGFRVLYIPYQSVQEAFKTGWHLTRITSDESTPEKVHVKRKKQWDSLPPEKQAHVWKVLMEKNEKNLLDFMNHLERAVKRQITAIRVIPLHGTTKECVTLAEAIHFVESYDETAPHGPLVKYEVVIRYDNGNKVDGEFLDRASAIEFLEAYQTGHWTPVIDVLDEEVVNNPEGRDWSRRGYGVKRSSGTRPRERPYPTRCRERFDHVR